MLLCHNFVFYLHGRVYLVLLFIVIFALHPCFSNKELEIGFGSLFLYSQNLLLHLHYGTTVRNGTNRSCSQTLTVKTKALLAGSVYSVPNSWLFSITQN